MSRCKLSTITMEKPKTVNLKPLTHLSSCTNQLGQQHAEDADPAPYNLRSLNPKQIWKQNMRKKQKLSVRFPVSGCSAAQARPTIWEEARGTSLVAGYLVVGRVCLFAQRNLSCADLHVWNAWVRRLTKLTVAIACCYWSTHISVCVGYSQKKFWNLTSDYNESCRWRSVNREMWSRRCDTAEMCEMRFWRIGIVRNAVFVHSFMAESQLLKTGGCGGSAAQDAPKFAPRCGARTIWKTKRLKIGGIGALFEIQIRGRFGSQNSKTLKTGSLGALFEIQVGLAFWKWSLPWPCHGKSGEQRKLCACHCVFSTPRVCHIPL